MSDDGAGGGDDGVGDGDGRAGNAGRKNKRHKILITRGIAPSHTHSKNTTAKKQS